MIEFYNIFESCITFRLASRDEHQQNRSVPALVEVSVELQMVNLAGIRFMARRCACPVSGSLLGRPGILSWPDIRFSFVFVMYVMYVEVNVRSKSYLFS